MRLPAMTVWLLLPIVWMPSQPVSETTLSRITASVPPVQMPPSLVPLSVAAFCTCSTTLPTASARAPGYTRDGVQGKKLMP